MDYSSDDNSREKTWSHKELLNSPRSVEQLAVRFAVAKLDSAVEQPWEEWGPLGLVATEDFERP